MFQCKWGPGCLHEETLKGNKISHCLKLPVPLMDENLQRGEFIYLAFCKGTEEKRVIKGPQIVRIAFNFKTSEATNHPSLFPPQANTLPKHLR